MFLFPPVVIAVDILAQWALEKQFYGESSIFEVFNSKVLMKRSFKLNRRRRPLPPQWAGSVTGSRIFLFHQQADWGQRRRALPNKSTVADHDMRYSGRLGESLLSAYEGSAVAGLGRSDNHLEVSY
jgi:hypothetical protein